MPPKLPSPRSGGLTGRNGQPTAASKLAEWDADAVHRLAESLRGAKGMLPDEIVAKRLEELQKFSAAEDVVDLPEEATTHTGDIWLLGKHRLMCGDSTSRKEMAALLDNQLADCVVTDPPYGVDVQERDLVQAEVRGRRKDGKGVTNDDLTGDDLADFLLRTFTSILKVTRPGAVWYVFAPPGVDYRHHLNALAEIGVARHGLVWVKDRFVMGRADYHYRHENIIYGWTPGGPHKRPIERLHDSVFEFSRPGASPEHPTMKPIALIEQLLSGVHGDGDLVLDPFVGSGTTIIACERTGRRCFAMELDPRYVDVAVLRWETYTGQTAELVQGSEKAR